MQRPTKSLSLSQLPLPHVMEENVENSWTISFSSHPLFSCFITLYTLFLIYLPCDYSLRILLSPVLLISGAFLFSLLLLGSTRESNTRPGKRNEAETGIVNLEEEAEESNVLAKSETDFETKPGFVEWNLRAPLEVIHEAYEEDEEEENLSASGEKDPTRLKEIERFPSLSLCFPESDSESDSEFNFPETGSWISPGNMGFRWEEEEDDGNGGEGLIEIKLDHDEYEYNKISKRNQTELDFHAEEDGLIEIDLFP